MAFGVTTRLILDRTEQKPILHAHTFQDVEDIIENNKRLRNEGGQKSDFMRHKASIPLNIWYSWFNDEYKRGNVSLKCFGKEMDEIAEKKLRDPDWAYLLT